MGATSEYLVTNFLVECVAIMDHSPQSVIRKLVCKCIATMVFGPIVGKSEIDCVNVLVLWSIVL